jgi:glyoxylase-like metal-dependent hydrolase (beta-lactamase superfamily II)
MCKVSRRDVLVGGVAMLGMAAAESEGISKTAKAATRVPEVGKVETLGPDIYFHEGNIVLTHCNNGWIVFEDYVLVIDANFPSGAEIIIPKIHAVTNKPIRFAFDTHHHGDHAYANQLWVEQGATPLAHTGVVEEMKKYETGYYGNQPGRWEESAKQRKDMANTKLKPPSLLFPKDLIFDDGKHRVELMHLGVAHTHGDAFAWLPKEKILFTGDACVNGPYNFTGDGDVEKWIGTLEAAKKLGAKTICPGHGVFSTATLLDDQQAFFKGLREAVGKLVKDKKSPQQVKDSVNQVSETLKANKQISRYVGGTLGSQVEKVLTEMTGQKFPESQKSSRAVRQLHAHSHGLGLVG